MRADEDVYSADMETSLAAVNRGVERCIALDPAQYLWSYKRFKTRPEGEEPFYASDLPVFRALMFRSDSIAPECRCEDDQQGVYFQPAQQHGGTQYDLGRIIEAGVVGPASPARGPGW